MENILFIILIVLGVMLIAAEIFAITVRIMLIFKYQKSNRVQNSNGYTARQTARLFLDANGLQNVEVKKCGWWRTAFFGNSYSTRSKTIYLRRGIIDNVSITAASVALQKCAIAIQDSQNDKATKIRTWFQPIIPFSSFMFLPIIIIGFIFDLILFNLTSFTGTIIASIVALGFFLFTLFFTLIVVIVENKANKKALQIIKESSFMSQPEIEEVEKLFRLYIFGYVADFIISVLKFLQVIAKVLYKGVKNSK